MLDVLETKPETPDGGGLNRTSEKGCEVSLGHIALKDWLLMCCKILSVSQPISEVCSHAENFDVCFV